MKVEKNKIRISVVVIILLVGLGIYYYLNITNEKEFSIFEEDSNNIILNKEETNEEMLSTTEIDENSIIVHITGEVVNPGIVKLKEGARLIDAIESAGGKTEKADYSKVNLAYILEDGSKIYVPSVDDKENQYSQGENSDLYAVSSIAGSSNSSEGQASGTKKNIKVNINTAKQAELEKLPGVGPSMALKIINYRKENGKFASIEDLKKVSGIGDSKFNNLKDFVYVK